MNWTLILLLAGAALAVWLCFRMIKGNRQAFSRENLQKSFSTVGLLTLMIIAVVALAVHFLKN